MAPLLIGKFGDAAADDPPVPFSTLTDKIRVPQISCGITRTTAQTHKIIAESIHLSAVYSGQIWELVRVIVHLLRIKSNVSLIEVASDILEPEGLDDPQSIQMDFNKSAPRRPKCYDCFIPGLEAAKILQFGYAIEYDYVDRSLSRSLALKTLLAFIWLVRSTAPLVRGSRCTRADCRR